MLDGFVLIPVFLLCVGDLGVGGGVVIIKRNGIKCEI
jgi:hypothetical protein